MKKQAFQNNAQKYLKQPLFSKPDLIAGAALALSILLTLWHFWFLPAVFVSAAVLIFLRSARVTDQEYEQMLQYLLLHNPLKEERSEAYEALVHDLVYDHSVVDDRIIRLYDIGTGEVVRGFDRVLRSRFYYLISLTLGDTHCHIYGCCADVVEGEVCAFTYDLSKDDTLEMVQKTVSLDTGAKQLLYLKMSDGVLLPIETNSIDPEALQNYFADCRFVQ